MKQNSHDSCRQKDGGVVVFLRLCRAASLKALPRSNTLHASCRQFRQGQKHLHVVHHQQCSQSRVTQPSVRCRSSQGKQLAALKTQRARKSRTRRVALLKCTLVCVEQKLYRRISFYTLCCHWPTSNYPPIVVKHLFQYMSRKDMMAWMYVLDFIQSSSWLLVIGPWRSFAFEPKHISHRMSLNAVLYYPTMFPMGRNKVEV